MATSHPAMWFEVRSAIKANDVRTMSHLLAKQPVLLTHQLHQNRSLMHLAAEMGKAAIVEMLVNKGLNVNAIDGEDRTPLWSAINSGECLQTARVLLALGADPNHPCHGWSMLHLAVRQWTPNPFVGLLLSHGAQVNVLDGNGKSPLAVAAGRNNAEGVRMLLAPGADPTLHGPAAWVAATEATRQGHHALAQEIQGWLHAHEAQRVIENVSAIVSAGSGQLPHRALNSGTSP